MPCLGSIVVDSDVRVSHLAWAMRAWCSIGTSQVVPVCFGSVAHLPVRGDLASGMEPDSRYGIGSPKLLLLQMWRNCADYCLPLVVHSSSGQAVVAQYCRAVDKIWRFGLWR